MTRAEILNEAKKCVCGKREQDYGSPEDNFRVISKFWSVYLGIDISPKDVSMLMALLKIARIKSGGGTGDSFVDLAGYAACGGEIQSTEKLNKIQSKNEQTEKVNNFAEDLKFFGYSEEEITHIINIINENGKENN